MRRAQSEIHTKLLRNPNILATARSYLPASRPLRILSFGCSMGDELASIKLLFSTADVLGCDVNEAALAIARHSVGGVADAFLSTEAAIRERGPYDLVCAFSSLCRHPPPAPFAAAFPYAQFDDQISLLSEMVSPGGALALFNTSYFFQRTSSFGDFTPVRSDVICRNGFVSIFGADGSQIVEYATSPAGVSVRGLCQASSVTDDELVDCVFAKTKGSVAIDLRLYDPESRRGFEPAFSWTRSELDGFSTDERGRYIDMRRRYRAYRSADGRVLHEYDVLRDSVEGKGELLLATYGPLTAQVEANS